MKSALPLQDGRDSAEPPLQLELFLAYEDGSTAERARRAVTAVLSKPEVNAQPRFHLWRLDVLSDPQLVDQAGREASVADILVVAMHGTGRLAVQTETRLKQWVKVKSTKPRALVISLDSEAKSRASANPALTELRAVAARNGVTVLLHFGEPARRVSGVIAAAMFGHVPFIARSPKSYRIRPGRIRIRASTSRRA